MEKRSEIKTPRFNKKDQENTNYDFIGNLATMNQIIDMDNILYKDLKPNYKEFIINEINKKQPTVITIQIYGQGYKDDKWKKWLEIPFKDSNKYYNLNIIWIKDEDINTITKKNLSVYMFQSNNIHLNELKKDKFEIFVKKTGNKLNKYIL